MPRMFLTIDIETSGPSVLQNGILAIGYCLGNIHGEVLVKKRIDVKLEDHHTFDKLCLTGFWNKPGPKKVLKTIQTDPISPLCAIREFANDVDMLDAKYKVSIVCDNPSFDLYFINYYLESYMNRKPLNYKFGNQYRGIVDSNSYLKGYLGKSYYKTKMRYGSHNHFPENDAEMIFLFYYDHL
jgi:hypothetical protein